jgi:atypical dual specificity phosphatase
MSDRHVVDVGGITRLPRRLWAYARLKPATWVEDAGLVACRYPRDQKSLQELAEQGVSVLINLHESPHPEGALARYGLSEIHLPVPDFTPPTPAQLEQGVHAIEKAVSRGHRVAVHCGAGLGRTGTLVACYLVSLGLEPDEAIARIRAARPGSVETPQQEAAVAQYARQTVRNRSSEKLG